MDETNYNFKSARKTFSRIGLALCAILVIGTIVQALLIAIPRMIWGPENWLFTSSWGKWIIPFAPLYAVAIPSALLILRTLPAQPPQDNKLPVKHFLIFLPVCFCLMYGGNIVGILLSGILSGGNAQNAVTDYAMDAHPIKILVMVVLAPLLEEYVCRKQIIDRTRQYGEKVAVFLSALAFGLLHQNLFQFFYAFALGLVFGYIYLRTGRLRYPVIIHGIVNFMGAVIAPWILTLVDMEKLSSLDPALTPEELATLYAEMLPGMLVYLLYASFLGSMAIAGLVLLIVKSKEIRWKAAEQQLPKGTCVKTAYLNVGMIAYILLCLGAIVLALLPNAA